MVQIINPQSAIIWQETEMDIPEPALLIEASDDGFISIQQEDRYVLFNYETIPELIKHLKSIKKP